MSELDQKFITRNTAHTEHRDYLEASIYIIFNSIKFNSTLIHVFYLNFITRISSAELKIAKLIVALENVSIFCLDLRTTYSYITHLYKP